jgi:hypothetical protein
LLIFILIGGERPVGSLLSNDASAIDRRTGRREGEHARVAIAGPRWSDAIITPSNDDDGRMGRTLD